MLERRATERLLKKFDESGQRSDHNDRLIERKIPRGIAGEVAPPLKSPVDKNSVFLTLTVEQLRVIRHFCQGGMWFRTGPRATFSIPILCIGCSTQVRYRKKFLSTS